MDRKLIYYLGLFEATSSEVQIEQTDRGQIKFRVNLSVDSSTGLFDLAISSRQYVPAH